VIHVFGDSHARFFEGSLKFRVHLSTPRLAFSFSRGFHEIVTALKEHAKDGDEVLFVYGEVDCRCQLVQRSHEGSGAVQACVDQYAKGAETVRDVFQKQDLFFGFWGPGPAGRDYGDGSWYDTVGTQRDRNRVTREFNCCLQAKARQIGFFFASVFEYLVNGLDSHMEVFWDQIHLSERAWPFVREAWKDYRGEEI
jgi:hypothetical protein